MMQSSKGNQINQPQGKEGEDMTYTIKKSSIPAWKYEITGSDGHFHNIAPTVESAIDYLKGRFGIDVKIKVKVKA